MNSKSYNKLIYYAPGDLQKKPKPKKAGTTVHSKITSNRNKSAGQTMYDNSGFSQPGHSPNLNIQPNASQYPQWMEEYSDEPEHQSKMLPNSLSDE